MCEFLDDVKESLLSSNLNWPEFLHLYFSVIHRPLVHWIRGRPIFPAKGLIVNIIDPEHHMVSVATIQLCLIM